MADLKILFYLTAILVLGLLPVYLFKRKWSEVLVLAGVIIYFFLLNKDFIWGKLDVWHDTLGYKYFMLVIKQWLDLNIPIGWNPYMNGGEPLYLFSNLFLWAPWVFFCFTDKLINVGPHILFNVFWVFSFLEFCIGAFLLFGLLYEDFKVELFCFITLILSGQFKVMLGQVGQILVIYYLPFILFCFVLFFKRKNIYGLLLAMLVFGIATNRYLPHYVFLSVGIFVLSLGVFDFKSFILRLKLFKEQYRLLVFAAILALLTALPVVFLYAERNNYLSPTRGTADSALAISQGNTGLQVPVNAPLGGYRVFVDPAKTYRQNIHHAFYIGLMPLLILLLAFINWRNKYMWAALFGCVFAILLGLGFGFSGYRFLVRYVPTFNVMRHSFQFAHVAVFYLVCLCGYGLKELLRQDSSRLRALSQLILLAAAFSIVALISGGKSIFIFACIGFSLLVLLVVARILPLAQKPKQLTLQVVYFLLLFIMLLDLTLVYACDYKNSLLKEQPIYLVTPKYPLTRKFFLMQWLLPPDISPLVYKVATLTYPFENYIFLRQKRFDGLLKFFISRQSCPGPLAVDRPIFYFASRAKILPKNTTKEEYIEAVFSDCQDEAQNKKIVFLENDIDFTWPKENSNPLPDVYLLNYTKPGNPNKISMLLDCHSDGFLVRLENYHKYWQAFCDGNPVKIYRANYAFQAIKLPSGKHKLEFKFVSPYPVLFWIHVAAFVLVWIFFNCCLYLIKKEEK